VCVCEWVWVWVWVYLSVTALGGTKSPLKAKGIWYQQKAFHAGNKIIVGIELKILGSKPMTV